MSQETNIYIKDICAIGDSIQGAVKISPVGKVTGVDGRTFQIDGAAVLQALQENGLKIVLNIDHGYGGKHGSEAAGWFADFNLQTDGIYATLALNDLGKTLLDAQAYKYLSPEFLTDEFRNVMHIVGVGLVNQPNLLNQALNNVSTISAEGQHNTGEDHMKDDEKNKNALKQLKEENGILRQKIDAQDKALRMQKIDNAIGEGKLLPAKKDFALGLDTNGLEGFLKMEAESTNLKKEDNQINPDALDDGDPGNAIFAQLGI